MGSLLAVHVTPKAGKDEISMLEETPSGSELRVRVTAPPEDGKANKAVCKLIAKSLGVAKSSVTVASGETSRHKRLAVPLSEEELHAWLSQL